MTQTNPYQEYIDGVNSAKLGALYPVTTQGVRFGYIRPELAAKLADNEPEVFEFEFGSRLPTLALRSEGKTPEQITEMVAGAHARLAEKGILGPIRGEKVDVKENLTDSALFRADLNLVFALGLKSWGVHIIPEYANGDILIQRRSNKVFTFPGKFDLFGGVLPSGKDAWEQARNELFQEAGLRGQWEPLEAGVAFAYDREVRGRVGNDGKYKPEYPPQTDGGTNRDEIFYWKVRIPDNVRPYANDGEVGKFLRISQDELREMLRHPADWKTNSAVMMMHAVGIPEANLLVINDPRPVSQRSEVKLLEAAGHIPGAGSKPGAAYTQQ